jgi:hypothetical protein
MTPVYAEFMKRRLSLDRPDSALRWYEIIASAGDSGYTRKGLVLFSKVFLERVQPIRLQHCLRPYATHPSKRGGGFQNKIIYMT